MPTPLHNHTEASKLDGVSTPEEIVKRCQELGFGSVACTDHDLVAGHVNFHKVVTQAGLKPILGIESYQTVGPRQTNKGFRTDPNTKEKADNFHLLLLAKSDRGLRNLWAMNTESHRSGFYYNGRVDWDLLERFSEDIICTSACAAGLISQAVRGNAYAGDPELVLQRFLSIFKDDFFLEISTYPEDWQYGLNEQIVSLADDYSVPLVYANDAHYAYPSQYELHETVLCMQYQEKLSQLAHPHHQPALYIMSEADINNHLFYLPQAVVNEAIDNSDDIAYKCDVSLPAQRMRIPMFVPEGYKNSYDMLVEKAVEGYMSKIKARNLPEDIYMKRFKDELAVIKEANLTDYLMIVRDFIVWAKDKGYLVGPGRGSIGGSLVAYLLGIHEIDPIRYGLIFERFYNAGRKGSMPDIDVDFPTFVVDEVKEYLIDKYGQEKCVDIGNVSSLQGRAAIQKIGMTLEVPFGDITAISSIIKGAITSGQQPKWQGKKGIWETVGNRLLPYKGKYPKLFEYAETMHGRTFTYGQHASGFLVADEELDGVFPLRWVSKDKKLVSQFDMRVAEQLGFMKFDLLALRNLDTLMEFNTILKSTGKDVVDFYDVKRMDEDGEIPQSMWEMVEKGLTVGIFQIESEAFPKKLAREMKPRNLEDIALLTALNRPGPMSSGAAERYLKARKGEERISLHPMVDKIADESYGEIIYQEQLINFFIELGYDPKQADGVRKITGKKDREEMQKLRADYEIRFKALGATPDVVEKIWTAIEGFADYAFNKAHSVEYGLISLWTAFAKEHNPSAFILASIRTLVSEGKKMDVPQYIGEAKRFGIEVLPVDMNLSQANTTIRDGAIRYGFRDVKGIGAVAADWLVKYRPFTSFDDIIVKAEKEENKTRLKNGQLRMAVNRGHVDKLKQLTTLKGEELCAVEEELLGYALSDESATILADYAQEIEDQCSTFDEADHTGRWKVAGIITEIKERKTKTGLPMAWVTLENGDQSREFTVWNDELKRLGFAWRRRQAVIADIKVNERGANIENARVLYAKD